ncbi:RdRP-domain-containing protein [Mycena chlorophos]|uniref:RdRP-domain-containing protein n=1 Tax=Mycena chlorophos TaxID=658473 RepID=A0A8H6T6U6_MYCCL|nr:RdRP-domain-containing protein [Mycena chlorophos]
MSTTTARKQAPRLARPAARYWKGKAPKGVADVDSDSDAEEEEVAVEEEGDVDMGGEQDFVGGGDEGDEGDDDAPAPMVQKAAKIMNVALRDVNISKDGKVIVAGREESGRTAMEQDEEESSEEDEAQTGAKAESDEESSEYESSSEDEKPKVQFRPVFVPKRARLTVAEREMEQDPEELQKKREAEAEERRKESHDMVAESIRRELAEKEKEELVPDIDDTDGLDPEGEFEAWRLRELARIKKEKEDEVRREEEREEVERRRALPEEQRLKEDLEHAQKSRDDKPKGQQKFLQKYWHKGAFHQDAEILKRHDFTEATQSTVDVSSLPAVMQVKNFGKRSRTKYTHLVDQDTTLPAGGFGGTAPVKSGGMNTDGGGCFLCGGPHLKKDCPQNTGPLMQLAGSGANAAPTGPRKNWGAGPPDSGSWRDRDRPDGGSRAGKERDRDAYRDPRDRDSYDNRNSSYRRRRSRSRSPYRSHSRSRSPPLRYGRREDDRGWRERRGVLPLFSAFDWRPSDFAGVYVLFKRCVRCPSRWGSCPHSPAMQLFMRNIAYTASEDDVKTELADRLHRPPFDEHTPMNFHVELFRAARSRNHRGIGLLTLPDTDSGEIFLEIYGPTGVKLNNRIIAFKRSDRPPDMGLIEGIRNSPWVHPRHLREEQARREELSESIVLSKFSFGRVCRDGVFSAELGYTGSVACNMGTRRLDLQCLGQTDRAPPPPPSPKPRRRGTMLVGYDSDGEAQFSDYYESDDDETSLGLSFSDEIVVHKSMHLISARVVDLVVDDRNLRVFLQSDLPPAFERRETGEMADLIEALSGREPMAQRESALAEDDLSLSMHTCQSLCLEFRAQREMQTFLYRCSALNFPNEVHRGFPVEQRGCYDAAKMARLRGLLRTLDFALAFEVDKAVWAGTLEPGEVLGLEVALRNLQSRLDPREMAPVFRLFLGLLETPSLGTANALKHKKKAEIPQWKGVSTYTSPSGVSEAYHLVLTPATQILDGPLPDQSNSVLRRFGNNNHSFLRVCFQDENRSPPRQDQVHRVTIDHLLENRYKQCLKFGLTVAGRQYEFLGYSMSGLKEYSFFFVSPFEYQGVRLNAEAIRSRLGDFSKVVHQPAMLGARWSQAFSASYPSITLDEEQIIDVEDRTCPFGLNLFSDGCSSISSDLNREVWKTQRRSQKIKFAPSAIQFRCSGAKGVLVANPELPSRTITLRPSQRKFIADDVRTLDIATTSAKPILTYLNRPLIALLEHHGVEKEAFLRLQRRAIDEVHQMNDSLRWASQIFAQHGLGSAFRLPSLFNNVRNQLGLEVGDWEDHTAFHDQMIKTSIAYATMHILREIKHRGHVLIPGSYTLIGVVDEWDCLEEGEIYATVVDDRNGVNQAITGRVLITRSPQIHPGDAQFVRAVRRPQLAHLTNVVVFSCKGYRSLPSMLGGGDLDGDIYNLILDETLYPPKGYTAEPGEYAAIPPKITEDPCTVSDVIDFVIDYIKSDLLGLISILHLRISDTKGFDNADCLKLAELASHAVDFQKRGVPVSFADLPKAPSSLKPDYLSGEGIDPTESMRNKYYPSSKALGHLYRNVPPLEDYRPTEYYDLEMRRGDTRKIHLALRSVGLRRLGLPSLDSTVPEELKQQMEVIMDKYSYQLLDIAKANTTSKRSDRHHLSEAELVSGTIQERYADHRKRKEAIAAMNLQTTELVRSIRFEFQSTELRPEEPEGQDDEEEWDDPEDIAGDEERRWDMFMRAWAAWLVAEEALDTDAASFGPSSFGLLALGTMLDMIKEAKENL